MGCLNIAMKMVDTWESMLAGFSSIFPQLCKCSYIVLLLCCHHNKNSVDRLIDWMHLQLIFALFGYFIEADKPGFQEWRQSWFTKCRICVWVKTSVCWACFPRPRCLRLVKRNLIIIILACVILGWISISNLVQGTPATGTTVDILV